MTITELLRTEHAAFDAILDEIETALPNIATLGELRILVNLIGKSAARRWTISTVLGNSFGN
jgi:hypothetical protein